MNFKQVQDFLRDKDYILVTNHENGEGYFVFTHNFFNSVGRLFEKDKEVFIETDLNGLDEKEFNMLKCKRISKDRHNIVYKVEL